jgi:hypothetical protein
MLDHLYVTFACVTIGAQSAPWLEFGRIKLDGAADADNKR